MELAYQKRVEILIKALAGRYKNINMPYDDLLQEGRLAAINAIPRWQKSNGNAKAIAWAWVYIWSRYRELSSAKCSEPEISFEERQNTENFNATDLYLNKYFTDDISEKNDVPGSTDPEKENAFSFLKNALSNGSGDIIRAIDKKVSKHEAAHKETVTVQRINQLHKKMEDHMFVMK